ncbi:MAG TPA: BON domain-containing protein [Gammaproteobacteria bacterium]|nr:BON domain-containing protein [Gammaproteobacteria bacterium]
MKPDSELRLEVIAELQCNHHIESDDIGVIVQDGVVTLTGMVETYAEKVSAERAALRVSGVRAVEDLILVRLPCRMGRADQVIPDEGIPDEVRAQTRRDIERQITGALRRHANVEAANIRVSINDGTVTLEGSIDARCEREAVTEAVRAASGVREVVDKLVVAAP